MNSRFLASSSLQEMKRRLILSPSSSLVAGQINRSARKSKAPIGGLIANSSGTIRSLHSGSACFASADALDMADTFARRHSKSCLSDLIPFYFMIPSKIASSFTLFPAYLATQTKLFLNFWMYFRWVMMYLMCSIGLF